MIKFILFFMILLTQLMFINKKNIFFVILLMMISLSMFMLILFNFLNFSLFIFIFIFSILNGLIMMFFIIISMENLNLKFIFSTDSVFMILLFFILFYKCKTNYLFMMKIWNSKEYMKYLKIFLIFLFIFLFNFLFLIKKNSKIKNKFFKN